MADAYQMLVLRKGNKTLVKISDAPLGDVYAMIFGTIDLVAKRTGRNAQDVLEDLEQLAAFASAYGEE